MYKESGCENHNRDRELKFLRDCKKLWTQMDPLFMKYATCRSVEEEQNKEDPIAKRCCFGWGRDFPTWEGVCIQS